MVAAVLRGERAETGIRPFNPSRDLGAIVELITVAFGDRLDPAGRAVLAEMHRVVGWGPFLWWLYWPRWGGVGTTPGFVWVEEGCVVGNVSLRRASGWDGFLVGNVAVHPDWQGRGIARALMEAALEEIRVRDARWVGLEVQADNRIARRLYERLGFREVGRTLHMLRAAGLGWAGDALPHSALRRGRSRDSAELVKLAHAVVPEIQRPLLELREEDYRLGWERALDCWLEGRREAWWVVEEQGVVRGAVRALRERGCRPDRLEVLVLPEHSDRLAGVLVRQGMASLGDVSRKEVETMLPASTGPLVVVLEAEGFQELRTLVQMRLELSRRILAR